jgi:hypothetical protein
MNWPSAHKSSFDLYLRSTYSGSEPQELNVVFRTHRDPTASMASAVSASGGEGISFRDSRSRGRLICNSSSDKRGCLSPLYMAYASANASSSCLTRLDKTPILS